ncbi:TIGR01777 family oxidoreductase [uncultured Desulfobacter sp.]|uniref:TIGR01777 family oxidoreductase n=1 Tax=uncultured Desulfobacter sp. TaxID=240139 RepID=UPI002AABB52F|nr:TIGR01777 family oxidoreductase [uncultured Desulfobacter sp.]
MTKKVFTRKTKIHAPVSDVFAWHAQDGAIDRLTPPWAPLSLVERKGRGIDKGVEVTFKIKISGIPMTWKARHLDYKENDMFRDCQVKGPFAQWEHSHLFHKESKDLTVMEDQVRFRLPLGIFSLPFYGYAKRQLERIFFYRHQVLKYDMENRVGKVQKQRILISGASGTIGTTLVPFLKTCGHEVIRLVRDPHDRSEDVLYWDPYKNILDMDAAGPVDAVINLNGVDISRGRWDRHQRTRILNSRVISTRILVEKMKLMAHPPSTFISASAIGFYGDGGQGILTEDSSPKDCFISRVCREWEDASLGAVKAGIRTVQLRIGVVLTPAGGALGRMYLPFLMGLGTRLDHGGQYMSWIGMEDVLGGILHILENTKIQGPVNLTAPEPVTNKKFTSTLARVLGRPAPFVLPGKLVSALWGDMGKETLLASARVVPEKLIKSGYRFVHPRLEAALGHMLGRSAKKK